MIPSTEIGTAVRDAPMTALLLHARAAAVRRVQLHVSVVHDLRRHDQSLQRRQGSGSRRELASGPSHTSAQV